MPELPDLEIIKDVLREHVVGLSIEGVEVRKPVVTRDLIGDGFQAGLFGRSINRVERRGKFLIFTLAGERYLVINPMLAGRIRLCPHWERHTPAPIVVLQLSNKTDLRYSDPKLMGKVYLADDLRAVPTFAAQGPEALDPKLTLDVFKERLRQYRGEIKGILTNQAFIAGIGNAYADEILFRARIYPYKKRPRLTPAEIETLYQSMRDVLTEAIDVLRTRVGTEIHIEIRDFLQVHGRGGQPCPRCGTPISEITAHQRLTNFCRTCQPGTLIYN